MPTFQITCDTPGASVYYTTDGSEPSKKFYFIYKTIYRG